MEVRVGGHGNPILWVRDVVALVAFRFNYMIDDSMKELHVLSYLDRVAKQLESLRANIQSKKLAATQPFLVN